MALVYRSGFGFHDESTGDLSRNGSHVLKKTHLETKICFCSRSVLVSDCLVI